MPRLSTYIKDDIYKELVGLYGSDIKAAALVEDLAVRRLRAVRESGGHRHEDVPDARLEPILRRLRVQADEQWQHGFETGLKLLEPRATPEQIKHDGMKYLLEPVVDWEILDHLAQAEWKLSGLFNTLETAYGSVPDDLWDVFASGGVNGTPVDSAFVDGALTALRQVWERVKGESAA